MKYAAVIAGALLGSAAQAGEPTIVDACMRAAEIEFRAVEIAASEIQDFPELSPPRVQMIVSYSVIVEPDAIAKTLGAKAEKQTRDVTIRCAFDSPSAPVALSDLSCAGWDCHIGQARIEELRALLEREGY